MRHVLGIVVGIGLLGCSGLTEKLMELSGSEIHVGADAKHPVDFPMPPPDGGTLTTSLSSGIGGMKTTSVIYEISGEAGPTLDKYEQIMKDAGLVTTRTTDSGNDVLAGQGGNNANWSAIVGDAGGKKTLTLVVIELPGDAAAPAPAPAP